MRLLISGGPGSGCTSTAKALGKVAGVTVFDSDSYFHKPSDPPFQEAYAPEERRRLLGAALGAQADWILSGSVATWGVESLEPTHGVFLNVPREVRMDRLLKRQRERFGSRIDAGGDMEEEHREFLLWAAGYEERTGAGRNLETDLAFLKGCVGVGRVLVLEVDGEVAMEEVVAGIRGFVGGGVGGGSNQ